MRRHALMLPIDPKGTEGRRFRCDDCGATGPLGELGMRPCTDPILSTAEALDIALRPEPGDQEAKSPIDCPTCYGRPRRETRCDNCGAGDA